MTRRRAKAVTLTLAAVGVCVVVVCGVAFRHRIAEQWWLYKLESGELEEQKVAAQKLEDMGSVRAVPTILKALRSADTSESILSSKAFRLIGANSSLVRSTTETLQLWIWTGGEEIIRLEFFGRSDYLFSALWNISHIAGGASVHCLVAALEDESWQVRSIAAVLLGTIGPEARDAVGALTRALTRQTNQSEATSVRPLIVVWALGRIGPEANEAIPALTKALQDENENVLKAAAQALKQIQRHEDLPR